MGWRFDLLGVLGALRSCFHLRLDDFLWRHAVRSQGLLSSEQSELRTNLRFFGEPARPSRPASVQVYFIFSYLIEVLVVFRMLWSQLP